jgi:hypothetical protein
MSLCTSTTPVRLCWAQHVERACACGICSHNRQVVHQRSALTAWPRCPPAWLLLLLLLQG